MTRVITFLVLFIVVQIGTAQQKTQEKAIKKVISTFFDGLHKGDSTLMATTLHKDIKIQTTTNNREGSSVLKTETKAQLLAGIANKKPADKYFEKLLSYDIKIDGNLASVWTPYEFFYNDIFSHCGANSFQMYHNNGKWEIIFLVDMRRRDNCDVLKGTK